MGDGVFHSATLRPDHGRKDAAAPRVSVMMLARDVEPWVGDAIQSILNQTFTAWEVIVVDDGSSDGTAAVAQRYADGDARIRLITHEPRGIPRSRNEALGIARGEYIAIQDADDTCTPDRLQRQFDYLQQHPECAWVSSRILMMDLHGAPIRQINLESTHEAIDAVNMGGAGFFVNNAYMARRDAMLRVGGFREQFPLVEDLDMTLRLAERWRIAAVDEVLYHYRKHWASSTESSQKLVDACVRQALVDACRRRGLPTPAPRRLGPEALIRGSEHAMIAGGPGQTQRIWAWWSLRDGHVKTARKYALAALLRDPLSPESWKAAACALRGR